MRTQNTIKSEIIAKAGLTKAEIKECSYDFEHIKSVAHFIKNGVFSKEGFLNLAFGEFADSRFKLNASESVNTAHRLIREHCAKLYFRAYKAA